MNLGDAGNISKLSAILVIPMIAAAIYLEFGLWVVLLSESWHEYISSDYGVVSLAAKAIAFFVCVGAVAFVFISFNSFLLGHKPFLYFLALSLLTFGLLGLGSNIEAIATKQEMPIVKNIAYWHLAALCWGFDIFNTVENSTNNQRQADA
ncbi:hypothetical protein EOE67_16115 [Rheinheimera riviphila]|uniref:Uncharacterized protein n=1 Tax=Rheinheimera riviphila TaxID=1834037 RepID=A0A437QGW2_9GAMM|nr:hypothetical protein [Rheinheimera riviphila]RVU33540.1 hypothetical protein EOE67_16115 [Rheinheimera riviphila]